MNKYRVTAERNHGIRNCRGEIVNPFDIKDLFDTKFNMRYERRTWDAIEAEDENAVRKFFAEADARGLETVAGFTITSIVLMPEKTEVTP